MGYSSSKMKHDRKVLNRDNQRRRTAIISHVNSNESNNLKTSNMYYVKRTSNFPYLVVQNFSSSDTLITLPKIKYTESSVCINDKIKV